MESVSGIIVRTQRVGESDVFVTLLTPDRGKVETVARAAKRSKRRFGGGLAVATQAEFELRRGRGDAQVLVSMNRPAVPARLREDFDALVLSQYGCEVMLHLAQPELAAPKLFGLLEAFLALLGQGTPQPTSLRVAFEAKALTFAGFQPVLSRCAVCEEPQEPMMAWSPNAGGACHRGCGPGLTVSSEALLAMEMLRRRPMARAHEVLLPQTAAWLLADLLEYRLGRPLKSRSLLVS